MQHLTPPTKKTNLKRFSLRLFALFLSITLCSYSVHASSVNDEYKLKAALIYKLIRFVNWPQTKQLKRKNFSLCILGDDDFGNAFNVLEDRKVGSLPIIIYRYKQSENTINNCQLVFVSESKNSFMKPILKSMSSHPILTISDSESFAENGGIIQITQGKKRLGFKINLQQANTSNLKIAAPLLSLATIVNTKTVNETP